MFSPNMVKTGIQILTTIGVGAIVDEGIKRIKPTDVAGIRKLGVKVGAFVMSSMVVDKCVDYVDDVWTETEQQIKEFITSKKDTKEVEEAV